MDNLFEHADDDAGHGFGAHGIFDAQAHTPSGQSGRPNTGRPNTTDCSNWRRAWSVPQR